VAQLDTIDRAVVRATFERRFSVDVMATKYESAYATVSAMENDRGLRRMTANVDRNLTPLNAASITPPQVARSGGPN
jgi:hypothetical protein